MNNLKDVEKEIMKYETPTTFELVGAQLVFRNVIYEKLLILGLDNVLAAKLYKAFIDQDTTAICDHYIMDDYVDMFKHLNNIKQRILSSIESGIFDDLWNRQMIIQFPIDHCVQTKQFLLRPQGLCVVTNMRSCNFEYNFLPDVYLSYLCGSYLLDVIQKTEKIITSNSINIIMNVGSLHIFKKTSSDN